jgi:hypothetical protein
LRRQFETFAHLQRGRTSGEFLRKTVKAGHTRVNVYANRTEVYHLFARALYRAIGEEDNRNRRARPPLSVKAKLMALDYVLAHGSHKYLATEHDKVDYFTRTLGIDASKLPGKIYRSAAGNRQTRRYFIEKYPLFLTETASSPPVVSFCYVDEGGLSTTGFESFLGRYRRLLLALRRFRIVYVAADWMNLRSAERKFGRLVEELSSPERCRPKGILGEYFRLKYLVETSQWRLLNVAALDRFRALTKRFQNPDIDSRFQDWQEVIEASQDTPPVEASFEIVRLPHNYTIFGTTRELAKQENSEHLIASGVPPKESGKNGTPAAKPLRSQEMNDRGRGDGAGRRDAGWAGATPAFGRLLRPKTSLRCQACFEGRAISRTTAQLEQEDRNEVGHPVSRQTQTGDGSQGVSRAAKDLERRSQTEGAGGESLPGG